MPLNDCSSAQDARDVALHDPGPEIGFLDRLSAILASAPSSDAMLEQIFPLMASAASASWLILWRLEEEHLRLVSVVGDIPAHLRAMAETVPAGAGVAWTAVRERRPIFLERYTQQAGVNAQVAARFQGASAFLPLLDRSGAVWGLLALARSEARERWPGPTRVVLEVGARMVATTLTLQDEARQRTAEALYLVDLTRELDRQVDPREVMGRVASRLRTVLQMDAIVISVGSLEEGVDCWLTEGNLPDALKPIVERRIRRGEGGVIWQALATMRPTFVDDYRAVPPRTTRHPAFVEAGLTTMAHVPFLIPNGTVGLLSTFRFGPPVPWTEYDRQLLSATVNALSLALQRAARLRALQEEKRYAETLLQVSALTESDRPLEEVAAKVSEVIAPAADIDWAGFAVQEGDLIRAVPLFEAESLSPELDRLMRAGSLRGAGVAWSALERGEATFVDDYATLSGGLRAYSEHGIRSAAYLPLSGADQRPTLFAAIRLNRPRPWSTRDRNLLLAAARSIAHSAARRHSFQQLRAAADLDALTGVYSRRFFNQALPRFKEGDALIILDLDHFKRLNDRLGHPAGDRELKQFGECLRAAARQDDLVARYGGEEFVVVLPDGGLEGARAYLERLKAMWSHQPRNTTFSAGASVFHESAAQTLERADAALYRAKHHGRDRYEIAEPAAGPTRRLLLIEDERDIRLGLTELLEFSGYEVEAVSDGLGAQSLLRMRQDFDVILLDLMMPLMGGRQLALELKRDPTLAGIPIIVLSGAAQAEEQARAMGAAALIRKPPDLDELLRTLERIVGLPTDPPARSPT